jgi:guanylate kinase
MKKAIIIAAPSGSGKTSIVKELLKKNLNIKFSVSATTRPIRYNEIDGKDYHFLTVDEFHRRIDRNEFMEYQEVYSGLYYGTLNSELDKIWYSGNIVLFDVDVVGGQNLKNILGDSAISIFIKPPDMESLKERLVKRSTETEESLRIRLNKAIHELEYQKYYDYVIVNDNLERAVDEIKNLIICLI